MITINAIGKACPLPMIETRNALKESPEGTLTLVDNEIAVQNLMKMAEQLGMKGRSEPTEEGNFAVSIIPADAEPGDCPECTPVVLAGTGPVVVALGSETMGTGNDELGKVLMKGFVYALTQLDKAPDTVLLYNGGAKLSTGDAPTVKDLKALEEAGTEVLTCGTCLNFYGLTEQLAVGGVTNMYEICSRMAEAGRLLKP